MHEFTSCISSAVEAALKQLLSEKHLYQAVEVDLSFIPELAQKVHHRQSQNRMSQVLPVHSGAPSRSTPETIAKDASRMAQSPWTPYIRHEQNKPQMFPTVGTTSNPIRFSMPTVNTFCHKCQERWPFNPVIEGAGCVVENEQHQVYFFGYLCQQCKGVAVWFMVRREKLKLRLVGRDPIEVLPVPRVLPKGPGKYFGDAQIAYHAGQTLAGIFLLRTFIEQYWRSIPDVQKLVQEQPRATGEEQGEAYQATLPIDFRGRFPSLSDVYSKLSAAMHLASADDSLFEESSKQVIEHFDARRVFKLRDS